MENLGTRRAFILTFEGFELFYLTETDEIISATERAPAAEPSQDEKN